MHSNPEHPNTGVDAQRRSLEALWDQNYAPRQSRLQQTLSAWGHTLINYFAGTPEPRIWQRRRGDRILWYAYDPYTQQRQSFDSEVALRQWLDQRYYR